MFTKEREIVTMTGDDVNDALVLKEADVGIVVDEATKVVKEAPILFYWTIISRQLFLSVKRGD